MMYMPEHRPAGRPRFGRGARLLVVGALVFAYGALAGALLVRWFA